MQERELREEHGCPLSPAGTTRAAPSREKSIFYHKWKARGDPGPWAMEEPTHRNTEGIWINLLGSGLFLTTPS